MNKLTKYILSEEAIQDNKNYYIDILKSIENYSIDSDVDGLIKFLEESDFFVAPGSATLCYNYAGGLCQQSINTYNILIHLLDNSETEVSDLDKIIYGLCSNFYKIGYYESYVKNEKVYSESGTKFDNLGKFDWKSSIKFAIKPASNRIITGSSGLNIFSILSKYIPLSEENIIVLSNFFLNTDNDNKVNDMPYLINQYPVLAYLHSAHLITSYCLEKID